MSRFRLLQMRMHCTNVDADAGGSDHLKNLTPKVDSGLWKVGGMWIFVVFLLFLPYLWELLSHYPPNFDGLCYAALSIAA